MQASGDRSNQLGLFNFAEAYRKAGDTLAVVHAAALRFHSPVRYPFDHSIELYLKTFLRQQGLTVTDSRGFVRHARNAASVMPKRTTTSSNWLPPKGITLS